MPQNPFDFAPQFVSNMIAMTPEKFGYLGSYSLDTLQVTTEADRAHWLGQQLVRFTMNVMSGKTISEHPEVTFTWWEYETWWDHLKQRLWDWYIVLDHRWMGHSELGVPPWMILLWPLLVAFPPWARRHPVNKKPRYAKTTVNFKQSVLYPQMDHIPPQFGQQVIYETLEMEHPGLGTLTSGPSRFLDEQEVISEFMRDPESVPRMGGGYPEYFGPPFAFISWLKRNGVNPSQLVKRSR